MLFLHVKNNVDTDQVVITYLDILLVFNLTVLVQGCLYLRLPELHLVLILVPKDILCCQRYDFLEAYNDNVWRKAIFGGEQPLG